MDVCAVSRRDARDIQRGAGAADGRQAIEAAARRRDCPALIIGAGIGADVHIGSIRRRGTGYLQSLSALNAGDPIGVVSQMGERPALVVAAAIGPLNDVRTLSGIAAADVERLAAVPGDHLIRTVRDDLAGVRAPLDRVDGAPIDDRAVGAVEQRELGHAVVPVEGLQAVDAGRAVDVLQIIFARRPAHARAERDSVFADDDRNAVVHPLGADLGEETVDIALLGPGAGALRRIRRAPIQTAAGRIQRVVVRVVEMDLDHEPVGDRVRRHVQEVDAVLHVGVVGLHDERARGVVAAGSAHGIDEGLVVRLLDGVVLGGRRVVVGADFVGAGEQHALVVVFEGVGDLGPIGALFLVIGDLMRVKRMFLQPAAIPMDVQDHVHVLVVRVVHHLFDARHPGGVDGLCRLVGMTVPGRGNADGVEAGGFHGSDELLGDGGVAPGGLAADGFHGVAHVPADADLVCDLLGRRKLGEGRRCKQECHCAEHRQLLDQSGTDGTDGRSLRREKRPRVLPCRSERYAIGHKSS